MRDDDEKTAGPEPLYYRPRQAAIRLGVSRPLIHRWIKEGRLPAIHLDGVTLIPVDQVDIFVQLHGVSPEDSPEQG